MIDDVGSIIREIVRGKITNGLRSDEDCLVVGSQDVFTAFDSITHKEELETLRERGVHLPTLGL